MTESRAGVSASILVLEDDDTVRELVTLVLRDRGYSVREAASVLEARAALAAERCELLISDVDLPDGLGLDVVAALRGSAPAIVLSSHGAEHDFARGFAAGAADYLVKPFHREELLARVALHLSRARAAQATTSIHAVGGELPHARGLAFGRYELARALGAGGFGRVYLARDHARGGERVALKVLSTEGQEQEECRARFVRESYALSAVRDEHVVRVRDVGVLGDRLYFAMDLVDGPSLHDRVVAAGTLDEAALVPLARGLLRALVAIERAGIVHRDVKPGNVVLREGRVDQPVLVDFGLAKRPADRSVTAPDLIVGTPAYLAPELIDGGGPSSRSDLYALGLTLRFVLCGEDPHPGLDGIALLRAVLATPAGLPRVPLTARFARLLGSLLEHDPARRPPTAAAALSELERIARTGDAPWPAS